MLYPHLLYLPPTSDSKNRSGFGENIHEGIIRLDRIFSSIPHHSKIKPTNIKIADEYLAVIWGNIKEYLLNEETEELSVIKSLCHEVE